MLYLTQQMLVFTICSPKLWYNPFRKKKLKAFLSFPGYIKYRLLFRAAGTSLSGQSITDGILVDLSQYWDKITVENEGSAVRVQPGVIGNIVNAHLKKYHTKIGPDPASINSAMMGGILSNNASGMCCGVSKNSYHTTKYIKFILPNGKTYSTEYKEDYSRFERECLQIHNTLHQPS